MSSHRWSQRRRHKPPRLLTRFQKTAPDFVVPDSTHEKRNAPGIIHADATDSVVPDSTHVVGDSEPCTGTETDAHLPSNTGRPPGVQIFVRALSGKTLVLEQPLSCTLWSLKKLLEDLEGVPAYLQVLVFSGRLLDDPEVSLSQYSVQRDSTINLLLSLRGGPGASRFIDDIAAAPDCAHDDDSGSRGGSGSDSGFIDDGHIEDTFDHGLFDREELANASRYINSSSALCVRVLCAV